MYSVHKMRTIATDGVAWYVYLCVCLCACLLVTFVSPIEKGWTDRDAVWG